MSKKPAANKKDVCRECNKKGAAPCSKKEVVTCRVCKFQMTINSQKLYEIQERLEILLTQKKVLNSKVISDAYGGFKTTVVKVRNRQAADVKAAIRVLENSLKNEGLYKNVKSGFEAIKVDITEVVDSQEYLTDKPGGKGPPAKVMKSSQSHLNVSGHNHEGKPIPRATTVTLSQAHDRQKRQTMPLITRPVIKEEPAVNSPRSRKTPSLEPKPKDTKAMTEDDMLILNKAISKLFNHLEIDKVEPAVSPRGQGTKVKGQVGGAVGGKQSKQASKKELEDAKELLIKLKKFEQELHKKRSQEKDDMQSLQKELQTMKTKLVDQSRQLERMRGTHLIATKAKGKHVERLEERHLTEKKDIEEKLHALEKDIKKNIQETKLDKKEWVSGLRQNMDVITMEILKLNKLTESKHGTTHRAGRLKEDPPGDFNDLLQKITNAGSEIEKLRESKVTLERSLIECSGWEAHFKDVEKEISDMCSRVLPAHLLTDNDKTKRNNSDSHTYADSVKVKLKKLNSSLVNNRKTQGDKEKYISDLEEKLEITSVRFAKMIDAIDKVHVTNNNNVELAGRTVTMPPRSDSDGSLPTNIVRKSKSELNHASNIGLPEHSQRFEVAMGELRDFSSQVNKYERLLQEREKAIKEYENDFMVLQSYIQKLGSTDATTGTEVSPRILDTNQEMSDTCRAMVKKISRLEAEVLSEKQRVASQLTDLQKSEEGVSEIQKEIRDLCKLTSVHTNTENRDVELDTIEDIRACKQVVVQLLDQSSSDKRGFTEADTAVEKLASEIHKLLLFTDFMEVSAETDDKKYEKNKTNENKANHASEELTTIHERFNRIRALKSSLEMALAEKEKDSENTESNLKEQLQRTELQVTLREQELKDVQTELTRLREETNRKSTENTRLQLEVNDRYRSALPIADEEKIYLKNKIDELQRNLDTAEKNLNEALKEKYSLLSRLSAVAGTRLTANNPTIADLSDPNRPTKLAEKFSELYDNEWTNAYATLCNQFSLDEKDAVQYLLSVVMESYSFCQEISKDQLSHTHKVLLMFYQKPVSEKTLEQYVGKLSDEDKKQIRDIRKWCAPTAVDAVAELFTQRQPNISLSVEQIQACEGYIRRSVELCWLMNTQHPPLYLSCHAKAGDVFDNTRYKQYTQSGTVVEFCVWPTLYLANGGAVLSKGVVQTTPKERDNTD